LINYECLHDDLWWFLQCWAGVEVEECHYPRVLLGDQDGVQGCPMDGLISSLDLSRFKFIAKLRK
jgi:hypothetical protein